MNAFRLRSACLGILSLAIVGVLGCSSTKRSWPEFRGPSGQGHSNALNVPVKWSETDNVRWKVAIPGRGWSTPVVRDDQIWMTTALDEGKSRRAICVDFDTGKILHDIEVFQVEESEPIEGSNSFASPSPVIDDERVYVHFGTIGTAAISTRTGTVLWRNDSLPVNHVTGSGNSPIGHGDLLFVNLDGMDTQRVVALHKSTGDLAWTAERSRPLPDHPVMRRAFATSLIIEQEGKAQLISLGANQLLACDPLSGEEIWQARFVGYSIVPTPVHAHGNIYFCTGFDLPAILAVKCGGKGDVTDTHVLWRQDKSAPKTPSPVVVDDKFFMVNNSGILTCLDAKNGEPIWKHRLGGNFSASPVYAGGHLYFSGEDGKVHVVRPDSEFRPVAENQLDGRFMASPAVVDGALVLRTDTHLYRIGK